MLCLLPENRLDVVLPASVAKLGLSSFMLLVAPKEVSDRTLFFFESRLCVSSSLLMANAAAATAAACSISLSEWYSWLICLESCLWSQFWDFFFSVKHTINYVFWYIVASSMHFFTHSPSRNRFTFETLRLLKWYSSIRSAPGLFSLFLLHTRKSQPSRSSLSLIFEKF